MPARGIVHVDDDHVHGIRIIPDGNRAVGQRQPAAPSCGNVPPRIGPKRQMRGAAHMVRPSIDLNGVLAPSDPSRRRRSRWGSNGHHVVEVQLHPLAGSAVWPWGPHPHALGIIEAVAHPALELRNPSLDDVPHPEHSNRVGLAEGRRFRSQLAAWWCTACFHRPPCDSLVRLMPMWSGDKRQRHSLYLAGSVRAAVP